MNVKSVTLKAVVLAAGLLLVVKTAASLVRDIKN